MRARTSRHPEQRSHDQRLAGLCRSSLRALADRRSGYSLTKAHRLIDFQQRISRELLQHPVITGNRYTEWFSRGEQTAAQIKAFIVQFSVFSNRFLLAQLLKMINAETLEEMRASKEILANEIGVVFKPSTPQHLPVDDAPKVCDAELVSTEGSIEGGIFHFKAGHFEWLLRMAEKLELEFSDLGLIRHGTAATRHFCDELIRLYGNENHAISQAASYAVENWAAAGFWDELVAGLQIYNRRTGADLPLAFFTWHSRLEAQHAEHTQEELETRFFTTTIKEDDFLRFANAMLDGVAVFWKGLDEQRKTFSQTA